MRERRGLFQDIDWVMVIIYLLLMFIGWVNIYAAVYDQEHANILDLSQRYGKQLVWIGAAILIAFLIILIDPKFFNQFAFLIYGVSILSLLLVLGFGHEVAGSKSWFVIGSFKIQPAEFVKFSTALALAHYLGNLGVKVDNLKATFYAALIILTPATLILLQNDTGSALVYAAFMLVLYRQGLSGNIFIIGFVVLIIAILSLLLVTLQAKLIMLGVILLLLAMAYLMMQRNLRNMFVLFAIFLSLTAVVFSVNFAFNKLQAHQQTRIKVLLNIESDPQGAGYNVNQSKIAIGSGGFAGKGFLKGTQTKFNFVPEQSTDFIFCTVGEEWGFLGASTVVILFVILLLRIIYAAERQRSHFAKIYGYGVASVLFFHFTINIGMVLGLLPVIGIPLPFFSYGGSSLWAFTILLFIFIRQDAERMQLL